MFSAVSTMRLLETARAHANEKVLRIQRARADSRQNEAERRNACIGDALCDRGSPKWQIYETFHGRSRGEPDVKARDAHSSSH